MLELPGLPPEIAALIDKTPGKRALLVIKHIIEHGQVSTEDLKRMGSVATQRGSTVVPRELRVDAGAGAAGQHGRAAFAAEG